MKLQSLQVARFLAAFLVVYFHAAFLLQDRFGLRGLTTAAGLYGWCGVDLFFVISGVVIARSARGLSWTAFALRRSQRILPLYLCLALLFLAAAALRGELDWRQALSTLTLWPATDRVTAPLVFVGWTLCLEALFYAAAALVLWRRACLYPLLAAYALALGHPRGALLQYLGNPIILEFLAGVAIAHAPRPRWAAWALPVGLALLLLLPPLAFHGDHAPAEMLAGKDMAGRVAVAGLPCALVIWGALDVRCRPGLLTYLGDASYAIYLCHWPLLVGLFLSLRRLGVLAWLPADAWLLGASAVAVAVACRVHERIEKPILDVLRRSGAEPRAPGPLGPVQPIARQAT